MTGVQTCALPICFPVTIRSVSFDEYRYLEDPDSAIESFLDDISVGCYDTTEQITNHSYWDKLSTEEKNVAIDTFNQYKS